MRTDLRTWLTRIPRPSSLRATTVHGEERIVRVGVSRSRWRDAEDTCASMARVEALAADGAVLRTWEAPDCDDAPAPAAPAPAPAPAPAVAAARDDLVLLGRLLADAADASAKRHEAAYRLAYEQQALLVRTVSERLAMLEKAWHRMVMQTAEEAPPAPEADETKALLAQLVMHQMTASQNGKASP